MAAHDALALLSELRGRGFEFAADGQSLRWRAPKEAALPEVLRLLAEHKQELLDALGAEGTHRSVSLAVSGVTALHPADLADAEAAYRAAWHRWWNALYERAGAMLASNAAHLAELEPEYLAARDGYFAAGDALEALDPAYWDGSGG